MLLAVSNITSNKYVTIDALTLSVPPGSSRTRRVVEEKVVNQASAELTELKNKGYVTFTISEDPAIDDELETIRGSALTGFMRAQLVDAADVTNGGTTRVVGFQITNALGNPQTGQVLVEFAVFDDIYCTEVAENAVLDNASAGSIIVGAGTASLRVLTDADGKFECVLTDFIDETVYLACAPAFASPAIDCREKDSVTFS